MWRQPTGAVPFYWRHNPRSGNVECASDGGGNCSSWEGDFEAAFKRTSVVTCQPAQYDQYGHWCSQASSERRGNGYEWKNGLRYFPGHFSNGTPNPAAIHDMFFSYDENGDIQCPSHDGRNCYWPKTRAEAEAAKQPLACGADHRIKHGSTGYDTPGHWCRTLAFANGNAKGFWYRWGLNGLAASEAPEGQDVMCASSNGYACGWDLPFSATFKTDTPLICGSDHWNKHGIPGYDTDGHWCRNLGGSGGRGTARIRIQNASEDFGQVCIPVPLRGVDRKFLKKAA
jgi:hypothetical protein